jgi:hypothetical protein
MQGIKCLEFEQLRYVKGSLANNAIVSGQDFVYLAKISTVFIEGLP